MEDLASLRKEYCQGGLNEEEMAECPIQQFREWFHQAQEVEIIEPNAMTLSTSDGKGYVTSRTVLLKAYDERGFVFFTNYASRKAEQIGACERVALLFPWLKLERQVSIAGTVEKVSRRDSLNYFLSRPLGSKLGAWVSDQSSVISSRKILEMKLEEMKRKFQGGEIPLPDHWGGYRVIPETVEFWQGSRNRLHDRMQYCRAGEGWKVERLAP